MRTFFLLSTIISINFISLFSQEIPSNGDTLRKNAVKLFIDCENCDMNHIRKEIPYVNYVRDVNEAQLYVRETRQETGGGGREYSYFFSGQGIYAGLSDTLVYASRPDNTFDQTREGRTNMLKMGLMRYVARTPIYKEIDIRHTGEGQEEVVSDNWNLWVFEIETRPEFESEEARKAFSIRNSFEANKVTPLWKFELDFDQRLSRTKYNYDDELFIKDKTQIQLRNLIVKSVGEHLSLGNKMNFASSSFSNTRFQVEIFPSVEYNLYPYSESTHRQLRMLYGIGVSLSTYIDTTIYNKISENLGQHQLQIAYQVQEKWGSINVSLEGSNYLHDFSKNRIELEGTISIRIVKGLSFSIWGSAARIQDQLSLVKGELSEADILLRLQELASTYRIDGSIGVSYTFGSIYNNVVNPRFGNGRRF